MLKVLKRPSVWLAIALVAIVCLTVFSPLATLFDRETLQRYFESLGAWAPVLFVLAHVIACTLAIPGTILAVTGGALFGLAWGTVWSVVGGTLGAVLAFWMARKLLHDWAERRYGHTAKLKSFKASVAKNALAFVLVVRFAPISPFNVVNFLFGLTPVSLTDYTLGTVIGIVPGTIAYTWLGKTGRDAFEGGSMMPLALATLILTLLSAIPLFVKWERKTPPS
ncbi:MAG: TVP38/TMEM64 family protein [Cyanobacteria bacterium J06648_11]